LFGFIINILKYKKTRLLGGVDCYIFTLTIATTATRWVKVKIKVLIQLIFHSVENIIPGKREMSNSFFSLDFF